MKNHRRNDREIRGTGRAWPEPGILEGYGVSNFREKLPTGMIGKHDEVAASARSKIRVKFRWAGPNPLVPRRNRRCSVKDARGNPKMTFAKTPQWRMARANAEKRGDFGFDSKMSGHPGQRKNDQHNRGVPTVPRSYQWRESNRIRSPGNAKHRSRHLLDLPSEGSVFHGPAQERIRPDPTDGRRIEIEGKIIVRYGYRSHPTRAARPFGRRYLRRFGRYRYRIRRNERGMSQNPCARSRPERNFLSPLNFGCGGICRPGHEGAENPMTPPIVRRSQKGTPREDFRIFKIGPCAPAGSPKDTGNAVSRGNATVFCPERHEKRNETGSRGSKKTRRYSIGPNEGKCGGSTFRNFSFGGSQ